MIAHLVYLGNPLGHGQGQSDQMHKPDNNYCNLTENVIGLAFHTSAIFPGF